MRTVRYVTALMVIYAVIATVRAYSEPIPDESSRESSLYDPDAQFSGTISKKQPSRAELVDAEQQQQARDQANNTWLLRSYEEQLRTRAPNSAKDDNANLYYRISSDKNLAQLAGLPAFNLNNPEPTVDVHLSLNTNGDPGKSGVTLHSDLPTLTNNRSTANQSTAPQKPSLTIKPLNWESNNYASLHNSYATPNSSIEQFLPQAEGLPHHPYVRQDSDPTALDTPGMTAAENDPVMSRNVPTLSLDLLPNETVPAARAHEENLTLLDPPKATNLDQIQKLDDSTLKPPGEVKTAPPVPLNPVLLKLKYEDPPVTAPPPPPIRTQIDDPRDMTFR